MFTQACINECVFKREITSAASLTRDISLQIEANLPWLRYIQSRVNVKDF